MGFLDGELAQLIGDNLVAAGMSIDITLIKVTSGARNPSSPTSATADATVSYPCQGFVARLEPYLIADTLIKGVNRVIKIYGSTLPAGVVPAPRDRITAETLTSTIADNHFGKMAVQRDPAAAMYTCQCL